MGLQLKKSKGIYTDAVPSGEECESVLTLAYLLGDIFEKNEPELTEGSHQVICLNKKLKNIPFL
jgi:hypothetical protein